jgi:hypothetical protein
MLLGRSALVHVWARGEVRVRGPCHCSLLLGLDFLLVGCFVGWGCRGSEVWPSADVTCFVVHQADAPYVERWVVLGDRVVVFLFLFLLVLVVLKVLPIRFCCARDGGGILGSMRSRAQGDGSCVLVCDLFYFVRVMFSRCVIFDQCAGWSHFLFWRNKR